MGREPPRVRLVGVSIVDGITRYVFSEPFRIQDALIIKKYPCCGGNHAMLDSLFSMMREHNFTYEDVEHAEVEQSYVSTVML